MFIKWLQTIILIFMMCWLLLSIQGVWNHAANIKLILRLFPILKRNILFPTISFLKVCPILERITKELLKSLQSRLKKCTVLIWIPLILTVLIFILKLTEKMMSEEKAQAKKTEKNLYWQWDYCLMQIRFLLA